VDANKRFNIVVIREGCAMYDKLDLIVGFLLSIFRLSTRLQQ